jgi:hypothetical protein
MDFTVQVPDHPDSAKGISLNPSPSANSVGLEGRLKNQHSSRCLDFIRNSGWYCSVFLYLLFYVEALSMFNQFNPVVLRLLSLLQIFSEFIDNRQSFGD